MSFVKFFNYNMIRQDETEITANSEDPFFPISNLKDHRRTKVFRTLEGTNTLQMTFDFKTQEPIGAVLVQASRDGIGWQGDLTIKANPVNSGWGSPLFQTTLSISEQFQRGFVSFDAEEYRFWRIEASAPGEDYIEISNIFIGRETSIDTNNIKFGWRKDTKDLSTYQMNRYGERFYDKRDQLENISAAYTLLNKDELAVLMDMFEFNGTSEPVWFLTDVEQLFTDDARRFMFHGFFDDIPTVENVSPGLWDLGFRIEQG